MQNIIKSYKLEAFPNAISMPSYHFHYAFGPRSYLDAITIMADVIKTVERFDFDTGQYDILNDLSDIDGSGNYIYVAYTDIEKWIYIIGSDLEYGILFSNDNMENLLGIKFLDDSKKEFIESLRMRLVQEQDYYNSSIINSWAIAARLSIMQ